MRLDASVMGMLDVKGLCPQISHEMLRGERPSQLREFSQRVSVDNFDRAATGADEPVGAQRLQRLCDGFSRCADEGSEVVVAQPLDDDPVSGQFQQAPREALQGVEGTMFGAPAFGFPKPFGQQLQQGHCRLGFVVKHRSEAFGVHDRARHVAERDRGCGPRASIDGGELAHEIAAGPNGENRLRPIRLGRNELYAALSEDEHAIGAVTFVEEDGTGGPASRDLIELERGRGPFTDGIEERAASSHGRQMYRMLNRSCGISRTSTVVKPASRTIWHATCSPHTVPSPTPS